MEKIFAQSTRKKALVVDDRSDFRTILGRFLETSDFVVKVADGLASGLHQLDGDFFHVAVVDLSLAGDTNRDGLKIIGRIKELREGTEGILVSAYGDMEIGAEASSLGAFAVVQKENAEPAQFTEVAERAYRSSRDKLLKHHVPLTFLVGSGDAQSVNIAVPSVLKALNSGGYDVVDTFVRKLTHGLFPVVRRLQEPQADLDVTGRFLTGLYWCKMLGAPIRLYIGQKDVIREIRDSNSESTQIGGEARHAVVHSLEDRGMGGLVVTVEGPKREEFDQKVAADLLRAT